MIIINITTTSHIFIIVIVVVTITIIAAVYLCLSLSKPNQSSTMIWVLLEVLTCHYHQVFVHGGNFGVSVNYMIEYSLNLIYMERDMK